MIAWLCPVREALGRAIATHDTPLSAEALVLLGVEHPSATDGAGCTSKRIPGFCRRCGLITVERPSQEFERLFAERGFRLANRISSPEEKPVDSFYVHRPGLD